MRLVDAHWGVKDSTQVKILDKVSPRLRVAIENKYFQRVFSLLILVNCRQGLYEEYPISYREFPIKKNDDNV